MEKLAVLLAVTCTVLLAVSAQPRGDDPLCSPNGSPKCVLPQVCRVIKKCNLNQTTCELEAQCLAPRQEPVNGHRDVCQIGQPILMNSEGVLVDAFCGMDTPCPQGTFCNTELIDSYSMCCRSDPAVPVRPGSCPAYTATGQFFCLDTCGNDGDCRLDHKCCQQGCRRECTQPENVPVTPPPMPPGGGGDLIPPPIPTTQEGGFPSVMPSGGGGSNGGSGMFPNGGGVLVQPPIPTTQEGGFPSVMPSGSGGSGMFPNGVQVQPSVFPTGVQVQPTAPTSGGVAGGSGVFPNPFPTTANQGSSLWNQMMVTKPGGWVNAPSGAGSAGPQAGGMGGQPSGGLANQQTGFPSPTQPGTGAMQQQGDPCQYKKCAESTYCRRRGTPCATNTYLQPCMPEGMCTACPQVMCYMFCAHGYAKDTVGCSICQCNAAPQPLQPSQVVQQVPVQPVTYQRYPYGAGSNQHAWSQNQIAPKPNQTPLQQQQQWRRQQQINTNRNMNNNYVNQNTVQSANNQRMNNQGMYRNNNNNQVTNNINQNMNQNNMNQNVNRNNINQNAYRNNYRQPRRRTRPNWMWFMGDGIF